MTPTTLGSRLVQVQEKNSTTIFKKMGLKENLLKFAESINLGATTKPTQVKPPNYIASIIPKTISRTRQDIKNWNDAINWANFVEYPKRYQLYNLYDNVLIDLHLQSQINNRRLKSLSQPFVFKDKNGNIDQALTDELQNKKWVNQINKAIIDTVFYGHSLGEFSYINSELTFNLIPRQNVIPNKGELYFDYIDDKKIAYRTQSEFGSWLIEFGSDTDFGLINGCVPHVLFKRFAQSCYSELCEIYGIPPRVLKTNTQDRTMVTRGEKMLTDMGAAAWFIIDESESFEFAQGVATNGDVYNQLIAICNNEISMGISGTVVGQDTKNGSNSKEKTSFEILQDLVDSDLSLIEQAWNSTIIPALTKLGVISADVTYEYPPADDLDKLWKMTTEAAAFLDVDPKWVKETFGIEVIGSKTQPTPNATKLNLDADFFV